MVSGLATSPRETAKILSGEANPIEILSNLKVAFFSFTLAIALFNNKICPIWKNTRKEEATQPLDYVAFSIFVFLYK